MFDRGEEPNYSLGPDYYGEEPQKKRFDFDIGKYKKYFVPLIVLIVIIFAVMFFLGSRQEVTFNISCADGVSCSSATIQIYDSGENKVDFKGTIGTLANGDYTIRVSKTNYSTVEENITVDKDNKEFPITLYKNFNYGIDLIDLANGEPIYGTQQLNKQVVITNNSPKQLTGTLDYSITGTGKDGLAKKDIQVSFNPSSLDLSEGQTITVYVTIQGKLVTTEKAFELKMFVNGGVEPPKGVEMRLMPAAQLEIPNTFEKTDLKAGETKEYTTIQIRNTSKIAAANNVKITIVGNTLEDESKLDWFSFADPDDETKRSMTINTIETAVSGNDSTAIVRLIVTIPSTAQKDDTFHGKLVYTSPSMDKNEDYTAVTIKVKEGLVGEVLFVGKASYDAKKDGPTDAKTYYKILDNLVLFKNNSTIDIDSLTVTIDYNNSTIDSTTLDGRYNCQKWLAIYGYENYSITNFTKGTTKSIPMEIIINDEIDAIENKSVLCKIKWSYFSVAGAIFGSGEKDIRISAK